MYVVYGVAAESPHFFMSTDGMCNTQCGFSISLAVLSPHFFLHSSEPSSNSGFLFSLSNLVVCGAGGLPKTKSRKTGLLCFHLHYHKHKHTHTHTKTSQMPAHVQFSSVTKSNQLCHPCHKSPSTAVAPGPDGNRPRPVALVSVS